MARKPKSKEPIQEELDGILRAEHPSGQVSEATEREEVVEEDSEEEVLAQALVNLRHSEDLASAQKRVNKLTKQERAMLLERTQKPPE